MVRVKNMKQKLGPVTVELSRAALFHLVDLWREQEALLKCRLSLDEVISAIVEDS